MGEIMKLRKSRQSMGEIVVQGTPHHVDLEVMMQTNTQTGHVNAMPEGVAPGGGGAQKAAGAAPQPAVPALDAIHHRRSFQTYSASSTEA